MKIKPAELPPTIYTHHRQKEHVIESCFASETSFVVNVRKPGRDGGLGAVDKYRWKLEGSAGRRQWVYKVT